MPLDKQDVVRPRHGHPPSGPRFIRGGAFTAGRAARRECRPLMRSGHRSLRKWGTSDDSHGYRARLTRTHLPARRSLPTSRPLGPYGINPGAESRTPCRVLGVDEPAEGGPRWHVMPAVERSRRPTHRTGMRVPVKALNVNGTGPRHRSLDRIPHQCWFITHQRRTQLVAKRDSITVDWPNATMSGDRKPAGLRTPYVWICRTRFEQVRRRAWT